MEVTGEIASKQLTGQYNAAHNTSVFEVSLPQMDEAGKTFTFDIQ